MKLKAIENILIKNQLAKNGSQNLEIQQVMHLLQDVKKTYNIEKAASNKSLSPNQRSKSVVQTYNFGRPDKS